MPIADTVQLTKKQSGLDTIPFLIMNYKYYSFLPNALTTNTYFNFDTINDKLSDKAIRPGFPYYESEVFIATPGFLPLRSNTMLFKISPDNFFFDSSSSYRPGQPYIVQIDFGDGNGWQTVSTNTTTYIPVTYGNAGYQLIKTRVKDATRIKAYSKSLLNIKQVRDPQDLPPTPIELIDGMYVGTYPACSSVRQKTLIYVEGIDPLDVFPNAEGNRHMEDLYQFQIRQTRLSDLRNYGYRIIVVDWKNSRRDICKNAKSLITLINKLKCENANATPVNEEEFVIIGESMGGLVANYALLKMETDDDVLNDCNRNRKHNTRLLITMDSPHWGAHIPMGIQLLYKEALQLLPFGYLKKGGGLLLTPGNPIFDYFNLFLNSKSTNQMLREHYETRSLFAPYVFNIHDDRKSFLDEVALMGGQPKHCKLVAMSNGALDGKPQTRYWDGANRTPNDILAKYTYCQSIKVLGVVIPLSGFNVEVRNNPNNVNADLLKLELGHYWYRLKVRLWSVKLYWGPNALKGVYKDGDLQPTSTSAGGVQDYNAQLSTVPGFEPNNYVGNGTWQTYSLSYLWGFANTNTTFQTDGLHWNFVPTASGLNWGDHLNVPYTTMSKAIVINNLKYDVAMGIPKLYRNAPLPFNFVNDFRFNPYVRHLYHTWINNEELSNNIGLPIPNQYATLPSTGLQVVRTLNREIGDFELYVENRNKPWQSSYSAFSNISINKRSPHYTYLTNVGTAVQVLPYVYSKDKPFITSTPLTTFDVNNSNVTYIAPFSGPYIINNATWQPCNTNFYARPTKPETSPQQQPTVSVSIAPNPATDVVKLTFTGLTSNTSYHICLLDVHGKLWQQGNVNAYASTGSYNALFNLNNTLPQGFYIIKITSNTHTFNHLLNITK